ncbi:MAG: hypothetical protein G01um101433_327 [Parcubacteria group bacterium Gr01-1014_33]|nr:MAG: hypothetical protein G01um101433_327 [Parcubacteria group bacterium Gr01-1014_33]
MDTHDKNNEMNFGEEMYALVERLYPICRSISGQGLRQTLEILKERIPLEMHEVPSGTKVFDWVVPKEWNIKDAWAANSKGERVIDFKKNNLHVVGYSVPVDIKIPLAELQKHLYSLEGEPDAIPYVTSYYQENWGFCVTENAHMALQDDTYHVHIGSELKEGSITYGEYVIPGRSKKEILLSTYVCHPSLANDNLSGPVVATFLAKWLALEPRRYTYRIIFIPETIGALAYLARRLGHLKKYVIAGFNLTCMGDDRAYSYLPSRNGATRADYAALYALTLLHPDFIRYSFLDRASDERQYCAPGVDLPVVSIMRSKYGTFPEYHTSHDDLSLVTPSGLYGGYEALRTAIEYIEKNTYYHTSVLGEPQLGKRGLYPNVSTAGTRAEIKAMMNILAYADGTRGIDDLSVAIKVSVDEMIPIIERLKKEGLLQEDE